MRTLDFLKLLQHEMNYRKDAQLERMIRELRAAIIVKYPDIANTDIENIILYIEKILQQK